MGGVDVVTSGVVVVGVVVVIIIWSLVTLVCVQGWLQSIDSPSAGVVDVVGVVGVVTVVVVVVVL